MIVLKIILYVLLVIIGIIFLIFAMPVKAEAGFIDEDLKFKVKYSFITLASSEGGGVLGWLKKRRGRKSQDEDYSDYHDDDEYVSQEDDFQSDDESISESISETEIEEDEILTENTETENEEQEETAENSEEDTDEDTDTENQEDEEQEEGFSDDYKKDENKSEKRHQDKKSPRTLGEKVEFLLDLWRMAECPLLKIFKGIRFYDLYIDFIISDEDAYKCALTYGKVSGIVYNLIAWLSTLFTVRLQTVDINAGFGLKKSRWDTSFKVDFRLGTLVIAGIWFLFIYIFRYLIPNKRKNKKK